MIVVKEKRIRHIVTIESPIFGNPNTNAFEVNATPFSPLIHDPLIIITRAVNEQIIIVSKKVPSIAIAPCLGGFFVFAAACARGALPKPASLEKTPLAIPNLIAIRTVAPAKPPVAAVPLNAWSMIIPKAPGTKSKLKITITNAETI